MKNVSDNHKLKNVLSQMRQQEPSPDFTERVMREIEAMAADQVHADVDLSIMLKRSIMAAPSTRFTHSVLKKIREPQPALYKPVINARTWQLIATFLFVAIVVVVSNQSSGERPAFFSNPVAEYLGELFVTFNESLLYLGITVVSGSGLLLLDSFLRRLLKTHSH